MWSGSGGSGGASGGSCVAAVGPGASGTDSWTDGTAVATVTISERDSCARTYSLSTTASLRDNQPGNPRSFSEQPGAPVLRTGHDMFDALYALALDEVREASVDSIADGSFNDGNPVPCPAGGCFETGRLWTYVWTRDTAYAVLLGLGALDPARARNSLELKTSERRGGGDRQIVQDTGSGGGYPISTDRVIWAMGAWKLLMFLDGAERDGFRDLAYEAIKNTAEHDRAVVFDAADGLYRGEQSFLDWREQSYPAWTADDTVHIGMSKALGTNVAHRQLLWIASQLAAEKGLSADASKYQTWADDLATAIRARFWLGAHGLLSSFATTLLDPSPVRRFDLLGSALAVITDVAGQPEAKSVLERYPHLLRGAPVIWPQQQLTAIYHNRAIWPFATALWLEAAKKAGNAAAASHAVRSLMRGAAMNLSNMENFEAATGANWLDDGAASGPVVNSQRQLWSVAGYVAMVHDVIFGMETTQAGIRFAPFIPADLRSSLFAGADRIALSGIPYRGKRITVVLELGPSGATSGALVTDRVQLNGSDAGTGFVAIGDLGDDNLFEITLAPDPGATDAITTVSDAQLTDFRNFYGPRTPAITGVGLNGGLVRLTIDAQGEATADISFDVLRDGQRMASDLSGSTASWTDAASADHATHSYCYSVETQFIVSGTRSQHAEPVCFWGSSSERVATIGAQAFAATGGSLVLNYGRWHYEAWGDPGHTLAVQGFTPSYTGLHYLQVLAGNGAGSVATGVTCAVKRIEVREASTVVASGYLVMPHLGDWAVWRESSLVPVMLDQSKTYDIVILEDSRAINMSELEHFASYDGMGGKTGRFNRVNIAELKVLAVDVP